MQRFIIQDIMEEDFGCEGRPEGYKPKAKVKLLDENNNEICVQVLDAELYRMHLDIGDALTSDILQKMTAK